MNAILIIIAIPLILLSTVNGIQRLLQKKIDKENALKEERMKVNRQVDLMTGLLADIFAETIQNQRFTPAEITNIKLCYVASVQKAINKIKEI